MTKKYILLLPLALLVAWPAAAQSFQPGATAVTNGGGTAVGADFRTNVAIGIPVGGRAAGSSFVSRVGFWPASRAITAVAVEPVPGADLPATFDLHTNYPNPFNPETVIQYDLPEQARVRLAVYDALGRLVRTLVDAEQAGGVYRARWDGRDDGGDRVASGLYLYRLEAGDYTEVQKMLLVK